MRLLSDRLNNVITVEIGSTTYKYVKNELDKMKQSVLNAIDNPTVCAEKAVAMHTSFETLGKEVLVSAIPNCHYQIIEQEKEGRKEYSSWEALQFLSSRNDWTIRCRQKLSESSYWN